MNEKIKKLIDCMVQLREAMIDCENVISCELKEGYLMSNRVGCQDGIFSAIHMDVDCGIKFPETKQLFSGYIERFIVVDGVKIFCLEEKEEKQ